MICSLSLSFDSRKEKNSFDFVRVHEYRFCSNNNKNENNNNNNNSHFTHFISWDWEHGNAFTFRLERDYIRNRVAKWTQARILQIKKKNKNRKKKQRSRNNIELKTTKQKNQTDLHWFHFCRHLPIANCSVWFCEIVYSVPQFSFRISFNIQTWISYLILVFE